MNYDLTGGNPPKPMPIRDNFIRDDVASAGSVPHLTNPEEVNIRTDVNGSTDKPFPQERHFTTDIGPTQPIGMGVFVPQMDHKNVANMFGQVKYARREGAISIYKDESRQTENDQQASARAEGSSINCAEDESEESQGI